MAVEILVLPKYLEHSTFILCATTSIKAIVGVAGDSRNIHDENSNLMFDSAVFMFFNVFRKRCKKYL